MKRDNFEEIGIDGDYRTAWPDNGGGDGGSTADYDVLVYQDGTDYYAEDRTGTELTSGTDGEIVLQYGIDECPANGVVSVQGEYDISGTVELGGGKRLIGYGSQFNNTTTGSDPVIRVAEGSGGAYHDLTADASQTDNHIQIADVSGFSEGDLIRLRRDSLWSTESGQISELHKIWEIDEDTDTLIVSDSLKFDYPTVDNAVIRHIDHDEGHVEGLTIEGLGQYELQVGIEISNATNSTVYDCNFTDMGEYLVRVVHSYGTHVDNCRLERCNVNGDGYGVYIRTSSANTRVTNSQIRNVRNCIAHSPSGTDEGMPRGTHVVSCEIKGTQNSAAITAGDGTIDWAVIGNDITGNNNNAIQSGARDTFIMNNQFYGVSDERNREGGFYRMQSNSSMDHATLLIKGNHINRPGPGFPAIELRTGDGVSYKLISISNNEFINCQHNAVRVRIPIETFVFNMNVYDSEEIGGDSARGLVIENSTANIQSGSIQNNSFRGTNREPVLISTDATVSNMTIQNNTAEHFNANGEESLFRIQSLDDSVIANNTGYDTESNIVAGIQMESGTSNCLVKGNTIYSSNITSSETVVDNGTGNLVTDNVHNDGSTFTEL